MQTLLTRVSTTCTIRKGKKKCQLKFIYLAPQAVSSASAALCVTDRAGVQPRPQLKPELTSIYMDYLNYIKCIAHLLLPRMDGKLSWPCWLTTEDSLAKQWLSTIDRAQIRKVRRPIKVRRSVCRSQF